MKVGKAGSAAPHAAYIAREGRYARRIEKGEKLEATESGNMPDWAVVQPGIFWLNADVYERKNGTTYREMEIALPRELSVDQRIALVRSFVAQEIGTRHAFQWAIHTPTAADGGDQPHVHLMFSERQIDGVKRDPELYFKRYNKVAPEKGGAKKGYGARGTNFATAAERSAELKALRLRWESMANDHLMQAGVEATIDMRSHAERGTGQVPEKKQLPSQWRDDALGKTNILEFRAAKKALRSANDDADAVVINLNVEREKRRQAKQNEHVGDRVRAWKAAQRAENTPDLVQPEEPPLRDSDDGPDMDM